MNFYCFHVLDLHSILQSKYGARQQCKKGKERLKAAAERAIPILCAFEQRSCCHWKSLCAGRWESNTGTFWSNLHMFTDCNEFRKRKPSHPCISNPGADFEHRRTGWTFYCSFHFRSWWKWSVSVFKSSLLSFVRSGHCTSESQERTKSHSSIPTDFGREQRWRMKPFILRFTVLILERFLFFSERRQIAREIFPYQRNQSRFIDRKYRTTWRWLSGHLWPWRKLVKRFLIKAEVHWHLAVSLMKFRMPLCLHKQKANAFPQCILPNLLCAVTVST